VDVALEVLDRDSSVIVDTKVLKETRSGRAAS
jgi:hypothetical protein